MAHTLAQIVEKFSAMLTFIEGRIETPIERLAAPQNATPHSLVFIGDQKHLDLALKCPALTLIVNEKLLARVRGQGKTIVTTKNVSLAIAFIGREMFPVTANKVAFATEAIHPSAIIHPTAKIGAHCVIGPGAVIGAHCQIAENVIIGANTVIEPGVSIGSGSHIHPLVFIGHACVIGRECEIHPHTTVGSEGFGYANDEKGQQVRLTHYGRVILEDRVHLGAGVQIDRGTFEDSVIGSGTKIDNHCHFGHNIRIGKNTIITGGLIAAGSVTLGSHCVFGGRTTITGHLSVADGSQIAGLSGISKTIDKPGQYGGYPLQDLRAALKTTASLSALPKLRRDVSRIMKQLGLEADEADHGL